ncbi:MAG: glycoside hydrolase family 16 protein, partial [Opitutales bacterium]|nr:glycoside hydrolase family 16 protein [Opitutales bacterium]
MAAPPAGNGWMLVWSDEFDSGASPESPNPANWGYETGYVRNSEEQYYTNELQNAYCKNGFLNIEAHKHAPGTYSTGEKPGQDGSISSASLRSRNKVEYQYGWLEMRAKVETQPGSWGAWWTLGTNGQWPDSGECDIFEFYNAKLHFNVAWWKTGDPQWTGRWDASQKSISDFGQQWPEEFHVWVMEWDENEVKLHLDDVLYNTWDVSLDSGDASVEGFQQPHYMLVNQAMGGSSGGNTSGVVYPTSYQVDY